MPKDSNTTNHKLGTTNRFILFIFLFLLSTIYYLLSTARPVHAQACSAQAPGANQAINQINKCAIEAKIFDDKIFNLNQIAGTADSLNTLLTGSSQLHPETNTITQGQGALATSGNLVVALYSKPPASGVEYFAQTIQKLNPNQPAYAADADGIGFNALAPVQGIWTAFRNIAYAGFVLIFVVIGFMIMFRSHISSQAVATIQDSVPRIVVAILLVTFSYAIAGLMVDLMFLFLNVAINSLKVAGLITDRSNFVFEQSIFGAIFSSWTTVVQGVAGAIGGVISSVVGFGKLGDVFGFFGGEIVGIIVGIAMLFIMFRIFLMLLMSYITIIILTISAPFFFLLQALPGNNSAMSWFKQMASNVAVFPVVALMFIFAGILGKIDAFGGGGAAAVPITSGNVGQFPLLSGGLDIKDIGQLIGFGILLMTPNAAQMVKDAFGVKGGIGGGAGAAIGASLGGAAGVVGGAASRAAGGGYKAGVNALPTNYDNQGNSNAGKMRYFNPNYWKTRGQFEQGIKEARTREVGGRVTTPPAPGKPPGTWRK